MRPILTYLVVTCFFSASLLMADTQIVILNGEENCLALGGQWVEIRTCVVDSLVVDSGTALLIEPDVTLRTESYAALAGEIWNYGTFISNGTTVNEAVVYNRGHLVNQGLAAPARAN